MEDYKKFTILYLWERVPNTERTRPHCIILIIYMYTYRDPTWKIPAASIKAQILGLAIMWKLSTRLPSLLVDMTGYMRITLLHSIYNGLEDTVIHNLYKSQTANSVCCNDQFKRHNFGTLGVHSRFPDSFHHRPYLAPSHGLLSHFPRQFQPASPINHLNRSFHWLLSCPLRSCDQWQGKDDHAVCLLPYT